MLKDLHFHIFYTHLFVNAEAINKFEGNLKESKIHTQRTTFPLLTTKETIFLSNLF